jgi:hypothetical protein
MGIAFGEVSAARGRGSLPGEGGRPVSAVADGVERGTGLIGEDHRDKARLQGRETTRPTMSSRTAVSTSAGLVTVNRS